MGSVITVTDKDVKPSTPKYDPVFKWCPECLGRILSTKTGFKCCKCDYEVELKIE